MKKGREQTKERKKLLERGEPSDFKKEDNYISVEDEDSNEETPILLLDVNLGNRVERLTLFTGDEEHLE